MFVKMNMYDIIRAKTKRELTKITYNTLSKSKGEPITNNSRKMARLPMRRYRFYK